MQGKEIRAYSRSPYIKRTKIFVLKQIWTGTFVILCKAELLHNNEKDLVLYLTKEGFIVTIKKQNALCF